MSRTRKMKQVSKSSNYLYYILALISPQLFHLSSLPAYAAQINYACTFGSVRAEYSVDTGSNTIKRYLRGIGVSTFPISYITPQKIVWKLELKQAKYWSITEIDRNTLKIETTFGEWINGEYVEGKRVGSCERQN